MYKLEVRDLHKSYGSHEVLKGVSLEAKAGDVISIIGPGLRAAHPGWAWDTLGRPTQARSHH